MLYISDHFDARSQFLEGEGSVRRYTRKFLVDFLPMTDKSLYHSLQSSFWESFQSLRANCGNGDYCLEPFNLPFEVRSSFAELKVTSQNYANNNVGLSVDIKPIQAVTCVISGSTRLFSPEGTIVESAAIVWSPTL